ncbi:hypothetical protein [Streptomyces sp. NBC_01244]|uniref:hypothetical protein n=1 Tax=Streptomyces sp. NBC_01244 TaxID=2903797 RepID=UPI002E15E38E|nr:hypothetical protein OG247_43885 [Streptomyces sp. NBC_01244]
MTTTLSQYLLAALDRHQIPAGQSGDSGGSFVYVHTPTAVITISGDRADGSDATVDHAIEDHASFLADHRDRETGEYKVIYDSQGGIHTLQEDTEALIAAVREHLPPRPQAGV